MTPPDVLAFLARAADLYGRFRPGPQAVEDWTHALADADAAAVLVRWRSWIKASPHPPTPADLLEPRTDASGRLCANDGCRSTTESGGLLCPRHAAASRAGFQA